ncbi:MAG: hypothetical protein OXI81_09160, partial [Paracoccaceae bacterium]|nr:hypothetical protein [Paracoccaceae bacterium]
PRSLAAKPSSSGDGVFTTVDRDEFLALEVLRRHVNTVSITMRSRTGNDCIAAPSNNTNGVFVY